MSDAGHQRLREAGRSSAPLSVDPGVAIILVTYYGAHYLERLYGSICCLRYPRERYSLLVIENGVDRAGLRWFAEHAPEVRVIVPGENTGYAGGAALGMRQAIADGVDYVAIITQDTVLDPAWLRELLDVAERYPNAGAIQPKILRQDERGRPVINSWGNQLHFLGIGYPGGDGAPDRPLEIRQVPCASGAGLLCRVSALKTVGVFDPVLFMYQEDFDLSWRMRLAGYEVLLAPRAVMHHDYEFKRSVSKFYYLERNRLINLLTHYRLRTLALIAPALLLFEAIVLSYALREGWFWKRLAVYGFFLKRQTWQYLRRKRREVQSIRRVPDQAIAVHLTGRIEFRAIESGILGRVVNSLFDAYWRVVRHIIAW